jgi:hypothetical protein
LTEPPVHPNQKRLDTLRMRASLASKEWGVTAADGKTLLTAGTSAEAETVAVIDDKASFDNREFLLSLPEDHFWLIERYEHLAARRRASRRTMPAIAPSGARTSSFCAT